jgi:hypothetical protein
MVKNRSKVVALCLALCSTFAYIPNKTQHASAEEKLNRSQTMLLNLKTAPESSGYYLVQSYRTSKEITNGLEKALSQLAAVDQNYAKYRGRPDDRFLQAVSLKVTLARQTSQELQGQLLDAYAELKSSVQDALISEENFPSGEKNTKTKGKSMPGKVKDFLL